APGGGWTRSTPAGPNTPGWRRGRIATGAGSTRCTPRTSGAGWTAGARPARPATASRSTSASAGRTAPIAGTWRGPCPCGTGAGARQTPPRPDDPSGAARVLRTGRSELGADLDDAALSASARDAEHLAMLRALGWRSTIGAPLAARGRTLGVITFAMAESG